MDALLNSDSHYETGILWLQYKSISLATIVHSLYAAALRGAATKGNTGVERIMV
jgi:hypothetical protein